MRLTALLAASLTAIVLVVGVSSAAAAERPSFADEVAKNLGVTPDKLRAAFKAALVARVDAAVKAGRLTPEQAAKLKEGIAKGNGLGLGARKGFSKGFGAKRGFGKGIGKAARGKGPAATYLGMTREALFAELKKGKSLAQVAREKGKSVDGLVAAIVKPFQERMAKAVEAKRLTKQRADEAVKRFTQATEKLVQRQYKPRGSSR